MTFIPLLPLLTWIGCQPDPRSPYSARDSEPSESATTEDTTTPPTGARPENVLLLTIDTLRADGFALMPALVRQESESLVLANFWTHSWTYLGMGTILTGQHAGTWGPQSHTAQTGGFPSLDESVPTLAEVLGGAGFATGLASGSIVMGDITGLDRGYASILDDSDRTAEGLSPVIVSWIQAQTGPWLAHLHVVEPHAPYSLVAESCAADVAAVANNGCPYDVTQEFVVDILAEDLKTGAYSPGASTFDACREQIQTRYDCEARYLDDTLVGALWQPLKDSGALDTTLVVIVTDHGEGLLDPWASHYADSRAPVTHGRASFWRPGLVTPGVVSAPTAQDDIAPTILGLLGLDGAMPTTGGPYWAVAEDRVVTTFWCGNEFSNINGRLHGAIGQGQHLLYRTGGAHSLYDITSDIGEVTDLYGTVPVAEAVWAAAEAQEQESGEYCSWLD